MRRRRRRRNNFIMSIALFCAILMMTILPLPVAEAANFTVSKSNVSLEAGKSSTITINAPTHTGRLDISSSNSAVATVNDSSLWVENDSKTITITAKSSGIATITIRGELYDSSADEENEFVRTVNVTVTKASTSGSTITGGNSNGNAGSSTSGSTSNNNQSSSGSSTNSGISSSGGQSSTTTSKPSISKPTTSVSSNSSTSNSTSEKTSSNSSSNIVQNNTTEIQQEEIINQEENLMQAETMSEEVEILEPKEKVELEQANGKIEETTLANFNGKTIIIVGIGVIAVIITGIGIFISKKILKK